MMSPGGVIATAEPVPNGCSILCTVSGFSRRAGQPYLLVRIKLRQLNRCFASQSSEIHAGGLSTRAYVVDDDAAYAAGFRHVMQALHQRQDADVVGDHQSAGAGSDDAAHEFVVMSWISVEADVGVIELREGDARRARWAGARDAPGSRGVHDRI